MRSTPTVAAAVGAALILALAGCSGGADDATGTSAGSAKRGTVADGDALAPDEGGAGSGKAADRVVLTRGRPAAVDRAIAYVGELRVEVDDVSAASATAITQVAGAGGTLSAQETSLGDGATAMLTFKVPPAQFTRLLGALGKLGEPLGQTVTSEDVTEKLVDLDARLRTAKASADRVRALLGRAGSITEIVTLEREVAAREAEVESMQARLRSLEGRVEDATLTVLLSADRDDLVAADDDRGFLAGLREGWDAFTSTLVVAATVLGAVLPFAVLLGVAGGIAVVARRRRTSPVVDPPVATVA